MKILRFPGGSPAAQDVAGRIASVETLLSECRSRQARLREDGRHLMTSLDRLALLARTMARDTQKLKLFAGRLRACQRRVGPKFPSV